jgi:hypothetical protein
MSLADFFSVNRVIDNEEVDQQQTRKYEKFSTVRMYVNLKVSIP